MTTTTTTASTYFTFDLSAKTLTCQGDWTVAHIAAIAHEITKITWPKNGDWTIDANQLSSIDSAGTWQLRKLQRKFKQHKLSVKLTGLSSEQQMLYDLVDKDGKQIQEIPTLEQEPFLARVGKESIERLQTFKSFVTFVGETSYIIWLALKNPFRLRLKPIAATIESMGYHALPIIALLALMIGIVLAYQMGLELRNYGADIFIVDLIGTSTLREFGVLLTSIMIAGRTGSAFTAQLGIMQINEEIDALRTMGVSPSELLILPRIIGLIIVLPLLTMWSDIFGVLGGMVMSKNMLGITYYNFLERFQADVSIKSLIIGLAKAPLFALIIAIVGCFEGMRVYGSAESVGRNTTRSVVLAIFFILTADAIISVILSKLGI